jgi:uncharacterized membrane protein YobD (UPF0266 family)
MDVDLLDRTLSIIDIVLCLADMCMLVFLLRRAAVPKRKGFDKFASYRRGKSRRICR